MAGRRTAAVCLADVPGFVEIVSVGVGGWGRAGACGCAFGEFGQAEHEQEDRRAAGEAEHRGGAGEERGEVAKLLWRFGCQGFKHRMPARWRASCRLEGRQVWLVRDARSDSYTRVDGLATVSAGPVFVVRALLSKIERDQPGGGLLMLRSRMLSRGTRRLPPLQPTWCMGRGQAAFASAQQKPVSSRATATATMVRRLPRRRRVAARRCAGAAGRARLSR